MFHLFCNIEVGTFVPNKIQPHLVPKLSPMELPVPFKFAFDGSIFFFFFLKRKKEKKEKNKENRMTGKGKSFFRF